MVSYVFTRREFGQHPTNLPRDELGAAMASIQQAIDDRPFGRKPFVVLHGAPGVGKSWLLAQIRQTLQAMGVRCVDIVQANDLLAAPEATLIELLRWCLGNATATVAGVTPAEIAQELSNRLDANLRNENQPIALFFDDLDYWLNQLPGDSLQRIYQQLWWVVLRHTDLPGLVICTSREPLPQTRFNPGMKRKLQLIGLQPFDSDAINTLATGILTESSPQSNASPPVYAQELQRLVERYACGHPLIPDWLAWKLARDVQAFQDHKREDSLRELVDAIIDDRLDPSDVELLIRLAQQRPQGFSDDDPILGISGPGVVRSLKQVGLVDSVSGTSKYRVLPPLACLYGEESYG